MSKTNHTFALCAYQDSPYIEDCIKSLQAQTVQTNIIIATSTPSPFIEALGKRYQVPVYVREGKSDIQDDWNFAYQAAKTDLVTIAHQDDLYHQNYVRYLLQGSRKYPDMTMFISDYMPIKKGVIGKRDKNSVIKRFLRSPLKIAPLADRKLIKKMVLALGNTICCPTCTYNKALLGEVVFTSNLKFSLDWDTFLKLAGQKGRFVYVDRPLVFYRIHDGATSKAFILDQRRVREDEEMFAKFWPRPLVKVIMKFYKKAYDTYS